MKPHLMRLTTLVCGAALAAASIPAFADDLTVVSFGGAYGGLVYPGHSSVCVNGCFF